MAPEGRKSALAGNTMFEQVEDDFTREVPLFYPEWDGGSLLLPHP